jgi:hypothetical protein
MCALDEASSKRHEPDLEPSGRSTDGGRPEVTSMRSMLPESTPLLVAACVILAIATGVVGPHGLQPAASLLSLIGRLALATRRNGNGA